MRKLTIETDYTEYADGSILITAGKTKVICTAMVSESVPRFLMKSGKGWVTAEYNMLPSATPDRSPRADRRGSLPGRTSEIQRLIGRSLRASIDMEKLGERSITIDCDVIQADGGTRTASISGGFVALYLACQKLVSNGKLEENPITSFVAAISIGIVDGKLVADLDYAHDSTAEVDMNVVMNDQGNLIEVQGTAEGKAFSRSQLNKMVKEAGGCIMKIIDKQKKVLNVK